MTTNPPPILIRRGDLLRALGISSETLRRWLAAGKCPRPDVVPLHLHAAYASPVVAAALPRASSNCPGTSRPGGQR